MGFFAVLADDSDKRFKVKECHLNLWSLGGFGRRVFYWDVGLRLEADQGKLSKFQLVIPFGTEGAGIQDLGDCLLDQNVAHLIFGKPVKIQDSNIDYGQGPLSVGNVPRTDARLVKERSDKDVSFWSLSVSPPIESGKQAYLRVRFEIRNLGRAWKWKRSCLAKVWALVDLRVADVRQAISIPDCKAFEPLIMPIERLNLFLIAPASLQLRVTSPPFHYMRLLEGSVWEPYLGRRTDLMRSQKLVIYEWRGEKVEAANPFRAFIDLSREFGPTPLKYYVLTVTLVLLALLIAYYLRPLAVPIYEVGIGLLSQYVTQLTVGAVATFLLWLLSYTGPARKVLDVMRELSRKFDRWLYRA